MKRLFYLLVMLVILVTGCTTQKTVQLEQQEQSDVQVQSESEEQFEQHEQSEESGLYKTLLSPDNELSIVRRPSAADFSVFYPGKMTELLNIIQNQMKCGKLI